MGDRGLIYLIEQGIRLPRIGGVTSNIERIRLVLPGASWLRNACGSSTVTVEEPHTQVLNAVAS